MDGVLLLLPDWVSAFESEFGLCHDPVTPQNPRTPIGALPQSSRLLPTPPLRYSLFRFAECGAFPLIVTMFPFTSGFYFFHSILITYRALFP